MDRRAWWAIVHVVAESDTTEHLSHTHILKPRNNDCAGSDGLSAWIVSLCDPTVNWELWLLLPRVTETIVLHIASPGEDQKDQNQTLQVQFHFCTIIKSKNPKLNHCQVKDRL